MLGSIAKGIVLGYALGVGCDKVEDLVMKVEDKKNKKKIQKAYREFKDVGTSANNEAFRWNK